MEAMGEKSDEKKERGKNWSLIEKKLLVDLVFNALRITRGILKESGFTNKFNNRIWEVITTNINALGLAVRKVNAVKDKWKQLLSKSRKEFAERRTHTGGTGKGSRRRPADPVSERIIARLERDASLKSIEGGFESPDGQPQMTF
ncbi:uncharacterized protein LOC135493542 [Lineus longissimus]|uniref:uncharacterized protein LOC135493542 n=1 Tax=Lineus longissimus TaxID=88925 RepID=UPI00315D3FE2